MGTQEVSDASPLATGLSSATPIEPVPVSPVPASIPSADALVHLMVDWASVPSTYFHRRYPFFNEMLARVMKEFDFKATETQAATTFVFVEIAEAIDAQAIEARRAATGTGAVHESEVPQGCAQPQVSETPSDTLGEKA